MMLVALACPHHSRKRGFLSLLRRPNEGRRGCVEECLTLNADELVRKYLLRLNERTSGVLQWVDGAGATVGAVGGVFFKSSASWERSVRWLFYLKAA
jgi:hypothetical protein